MNLSLLWCARRCFVHDSSRLLGLLVVVLVIGIATNLVIVVDANKKKQRASSSLEVCQPGQTNTNNNKHCTPIPTCGMYMAESTIPGAGVGIFTAKPKQPGDIVGHGDVCIPVIDMYWNNGEKLPHNPFKDYFWTGDIMGMMFESDTDDIEALCPGLDCAINCNLALINVNKATPIFDDAGLHRSRDPGAGAFTPYHNGTTIVSRPIPAGGELFKFYGDNWFKTREYKFGKVPLSNDYPHAEALLEALQHLNVKDRSILQDCYSMVINSINKGSFESRTLNALPKSLDEALLAADAGELAALHQPHAIRSIEWLQQHGKCIDHIRPGMSTIPQAGHGAFAEHNIPAGTIITASPLHHVPRDRFMNMYKFIQVKGQWVRVMDEIDRHQILLNYCFGHPFSSVLLCPYGAGINYINHDRTLVNVKIQWATNFDLVHNQTFVDELTVKDLEQTHRPVLAFDYIATRDIMQGDELFLDYGNVWEDAWNNHVHQFQEGIDPGYTSAHQWNEIFTDMVLRTNMEQQVDPYPSHLQIRCHRSLINEGPQLGYYYDWQAKDYGEPCRVIDRFVEDDEYLYTIIIEIRTKDPRPNNDDDEDYDDDDNYKSSQTNKNKTVTWIERTDVPRSGIRFFDVPRTTDIHLKGAFRHAIQIPDDIFPIQWRNKEESP